MIKKLIGSAGIAAFWLSWPALYVYFKRSGPRSRVIVICNGEVLLVRGILSSSNRWKLPGGGSDANELPATTAERELREEVGIVTETSSLKLLGNGKLRRSGFSYDQNYLLLELDRKPELKLQWHEILHARWQPLSELDDITLEPDVLYGLELFRTDIKTRPVN